jgi:hypothetical protein
MKMNYKLATVGLIILAIVGTIALALAGESTVQKSSNGGTIDITGISPSSPERKYVIESRRYVDGDGKTTFDQWITSSNVMEINEKYQYVVFYPLEGEGAGKKHYIPFSNIHKIREL